MFNAFVDPQPDGGGSRLPFGAGLLIATAFSLLLWGVIAVLVLKFL